MDSDNQTPQNPGGIAGKPLYPEIKSDNKASEALTAANVIPAPPAKPDMQPTIDALHKHSLQNIRTYESDVAEMMKGKNPPVVKIPAPQDSRAIQRQQPVVRDAGIRKIKLHGDLNEVPEAHIIEEHISIKKGIPKPQVRPEILRQPVIREQPVQQAVIRTPQREIHHEDLPRPIIRRVEPVRPVAPAVLPRQEIPPPRIQPVAMPVPRQAPPPRPEPKPVSISSGARTGVFSLALSALLIIGGMAAISALLIWWKRQPTKPPPIKVDPTQVVVTEQGEEVVLGPNDNPLSVIASKSRSVTAKEDSLYKFSFVEEVTQNHVQIKKNVDTQTFVTRFQSGAESSFIRSLGDYYSSGFYIHEGTNYPFFIFGLNSYENAFAGMLSWEKTLPKDLAYILPSLPTLSTTATTTATSTKKTKTSTPTTAPQPKPIGFEDLIVQNKDVRAIRNAAGTPIILYSLPDKETLVITTSEAALREILARLVTSSFTK